MQNLNKNHKNFFIDLKKIADQYNFKGLSKVFNIDASLTKWNHIEKK